MVLPTPAPSAPQAHTCRKVSASPGPLVGSSPGWPAEPGYVLVPYPRPGSSVLPAWGDPRESGSVSKNQHQALFTTERGAGLQLVEPRASWRVSVVQPEGGRGAPGPSSSRSSLGNALGLPGLPLTSPTVSAGGGRPAPCVFAFIRCLEECEL